MEVSTKPVQKISFSSKILKVEFSPFEWSKTLIAIALEDKISVGIVKFKEEEEELEEDVEFEELKEFHHEITIHSIAWSPETLLSVLPKCVSFCTAGSDFNIRIYNSDLVENHTLQIVSGHSDYINEVRYETEGEYLASVSDDNTCKLWSLKSGNQCISTFCLSSPGVSVCFHRNESGKMLVAEKNGIIRMYNMMTEQAILSFDTYRIPLMSADWSPSNCLNVAAVAGGYLFVWDVTRPSRPIEARPVHTEGAQLVRFSQTSEKHQATLGEPDHQFKITHSRNKHPIMTCSLKLHGGLSWHYHLPYACVGNDRVLCFWKISTK